MIAKMKQLCAKLKEGNMNPQGQSYIPNPHIDFETFAEWMTKKGKRNRTVELNLKVIHKFNAEINEKNISTWTNHITMGTTIRSDNENAIIRMNYTVWNSLVMYLESIDRLELIELLPKTRRVIKPKSKPSDKSVSQEDWNIIIENCDDEMMLDTILIMRNIGLRVGEIIHMKKSWVMSRLIPKEEESKDDESPKKKIMIKRMILRIPADISKNRQDDDVPLDEDTYNIIQKWTKDKDRKDYVFTKNIKDNKGKNKLKLLNYNDFYKVYKKIVKEENEKEKEHKMSHFFPHKFRHTFCHDMEEGGCLMSQLQGLMRHSDPSTTGRYTTQNQDVTFNKFFDVKKKKKEKKKENKPISI